ncbi:MAG: sulfotransferase [Acidimicrobiia bacterium]
MPDTSTRPRGRMETFARESAKRALHGYGRATAGLRVHPDFLLIGAKRGGTTSLWRYLTEHPDVLGLFPRAEKPKGFYYFDEQFGRGDGWYRSHFPTRFRHGATSADGGRRMVGEATPYYLYHPLAPMRAHAVVPDAQILVVLRDPVERAYSHYKERRANDTEPLSFADAVAAEEARLVGEETRIRTEPGYVSFGHRHCSYLDQGRYAPMLERWFAAYGRDRVHVEISEEMYADPQATLDRVTHRLGIRRHELRDRSVHNAEPDHDLDPDLRAELVERLDPAVRATEELLGRALPWSRSARVHAS